MKRSGLAITYLDLTLPKSTVCALWFANVESRSTAASFGNQ